MGNKYKIDINHAKQRRFLKYAKIIIFILVLLVALGIGAIIIDSIIEKNKAAPPSAPTKPLNSTVESKVEVWTTPYFQFQTDKNWKLIANESTSTKFVYRRGTDNLVSADMTIFVNSSPEDTQATRVLPLSISDDGFRLKASFVSDHCNAKLPKDIKSTTGELPITLSSVRFLCDVDGTNFTIIAGLENGTSVMNLKRPDGTNANYVIYMRDLRSSAIPKEFENILDTFQVR